jgi:Na+/melibiose symporter-like transporter
MLKDKGILKAIWAGMFVVCCVLGFIPDPGAGGQIVMVAMAGLFFVPAYADAYFAWKNRDHKELRLIRNLCILSLGSTLVVLVANLLSLLTSSLELGDALYYLLVVVSTPMICGRYWVYSLLLWAILLWCCIAALRPKKRK